jgi:streptogramin lyase
MRRSRWVLLVGSTAAAVAAAVSAGIWMVSRPAPPAAVSPTIRPPSPIAARIRIDDRPRHLLLGADGLWVVGDRFLHRIDPSSDRVVARVPVGTRTATPDGLALSGELAWVPGETSNVLWRVDRATNQVRGTVRLERALYGPVGVAAHDDSIWVTCCAFQYGQRPAGTLLRIDLRRGRVVRPMPVPEGPLAVVAHRESVWVATARGSVLKVDPATHRIVLRVPPVSPNSRIQALAAGSDGQIWVADTGVGSLRRLDPATGRFNLTVDVPIPRNLAAGSGTVWVTTGRNRTLLRIDERTGRLGARIAATVLGGVRGIAVGTDAVWLTSGNYALHIDPTRLAN